MISYLAIKEEPQRGLGLAGLSLGYESVAEG